MYHHKLMYFCQRCRQEHDRTQESMFDASVKCDRDNCNGWVITPSGQANIKVEIEASLFMIKGEFATAWIGAYTQRDAIDMFTSQFGEFYNGIHKLSGEDLEAVKFAYKFNEDDEEEEITWLKAKQSLVLKEDLPAIVYAISNDDLEERIRENREDES